MLDELRYATRRLKRNPHISAVALITLTIAFIGTIAILSLLRAVVLRPLPLPSPGTLIGVFPANGEALFGVRGSTLSLLSERQQVLTGLCAMSHGTAATQVEATGPAKTRPVEGVSGECARTLGFALTIGRTITPKDAPEVGVASQVALIGHRLWQDEFGGTDAALGKLIFVQGVPLTVIGVLSQDYTGIDRDESLDLMVPLSHAAGSKSKDPLAGRLIGRLRPGLTVDAAAAQLRAIWPTVWRESNPLAQPGAPSRAGLAENLQIVAMEHGFSSLRNRYENALYALTALAALMLALGCVSVGGVLVAKKIDEWHQVRALVALGATASRLSIQVFLEIALLVFAGLILAIPVANWISRGIALTLWTSSRPLQMDVNADLWLYVVLLFVAIGCTGLISFPLIVMVRQSQNQIGTGGDRSIFKTTSLPRGMVTAGQTAIAYALLFVSGLFLVNLNSIRSINLGFSTQNLIWTRLEPVFGAPRSYDLDTYARAVVDAAKSIPGVEEAALAVSFPTTSLAQATIKEPYISEESGTQATVSVVSEWISPGFFSTTGTPLLSGRDFSWQDGSAQQNVVIINEFMAEALFQHSNAVGRTIKSSAQNRALTVIGVAANSSPGDPRINAVPRVYRPIIQEPRFAGAPTLSLRLRNNNPVSLDLVRRAIQPLGRHDVSYVRTIEEQRDRFLAQERVLANLSLAFAAFATIIGTLGLYGAMTQLVNRRMREIGLRLALGATTRLIVVGVIRHAAALVGVGLVIGLPLSFAIGRPLSGLLLDPSLARANLVAACIVCIAIIGVLAAALPATRATRISPTDAMRLE
jgi:predicted permease